MQKKILVTLLALCMLLAVLPFALTAGAATEMGTTVRDCEHELADGATTCSQCGATAISTATELAALMDGSDKSGTNYYLADNIDMTDTTQASITSFSGVFDGNGKTISGLNTTYGLFAAATDAWIYDLTVEGTVNNGDNGLAGGIVGNGTQAAGQTLHIENCTNKCNVTSTCATSNKRYAGGIVGAIGLGNDAIYGTATIIGCRNEGTVESTGSTSQIGGIVGYTRSVGLVTITGCDNTGTVTATSGKDAGGILGCGFTLESASYVGVLEVSDCTNTGAITDADNVGGVVGRILIYNATTVSIENCYNDVEMEGYALLASFTDNHKIGTFVCQGNYYTGGAEDSRATKVADIKLISSKDDLLTLMGTSEEWNANNCYILQDDIDLENAEEQNPIGNSDTPFTGAFVGNGHVISGINITGTASDVGLFGFVNEAAIHDLTIAGTINGGKDYTGGFVGFGKALTVTNCVNECTITGGNYVGGIVGALGCNSGNPRNATASGTVTGCRNKGTISGTAYVGGIVGYTRTTGAVTVAECMNQGTVKATTNSTSEVGGIVGLTWGYIAASSSGEVAVSNCINTGAISGDGTRVGGIVGRTYANSSAQYCYNAGTTTSAKTTGVGAIVGVVDTTCTGEFVNNYYTAGTTDANGTYVDPDDKANADTYTDWSADIWTFTSAGPRFTSYIVEIGTADEFIALTQNSDEWDDGNFYILTADIDLTEVTNQTPIGNSTTPFVGGFDGAGHTISGINLIYTDGTDCVGLFGKVKNTEIYDLTVEGSVTGDLYVGGIVGDGTPAAGEYLYIENCTNKCNVSGTQQVGGVVGVIGRSTSATASKGTATVIGCCNDGEIKATHASKAQVGGIVGYVHSNDYQNHVITECMNTRSVTGGTEGALVQDVGGILGIAWFATVSDCINTGDVTGKDDTYIGGIIGRTEGTNLVTNCYNGGTITGYSIVGGTDSDVIKSNNYYTADKNQNSSYGTYVAAADLGDASKFTNLNTHGKWMLTDNGPALKRFTVEISAEVVATTEDTVTVDLYAESGVPFWGVLVNINTGLTFDSCTIEENATDFTSEASNDGTTVALLQLDVADSTLAKTKIATLTYSVGEATGIQDITVTISEAEDSNGDVVAAYGDSASVSVDLLGVTYGHGVVLYSEYILEYTVKTEKLAEGIDEEDCFMLFESTDANGKTVATVVDAYTLNNRFRFSAPGIAAKNMGDEVKGTFFYVDAEGNRHYGFTDTYNLVDYYTTMSASDKLDNYPGLKTLLDAMLNYGAAAETYFGYDTDTSVSTSLSGDYTATFEAVDEGTGPIFGDATGSYTAAGLSAVLNQRIELVVGFSLNESAEAIDASKLVFEGEYEDINGEKQTFTISGEDFTVDTATNTIIVYIDQIAAKDLRQMVTGALRQGGTQVSQSITFNFDCYVNNNSDADLATLCDAILAYIDAAAAYLGPKE